MERLTLVGQMGAGKSTVARLLAARWADLGFEAVDLDARVAQLAGASIPELFARDGEASFRRLERAALDAALTAVDADGRPARTILATGGGAPCATEGAMDAILAAGPCVWLNAPADVLAARALSAGGRPLIAGLDLAGATALFEAQRHQRGPVYARAHHVVDASAPADAVAAAIAALIPPERPWPTS